MQAFISFSFSIYGDKEAEIYLPEFSVFTVYIKRTIYATIWMEAIYQTSIHFIFKQ